MRTKIRVAKIEVPPEIASGIDGEPAWIKVKTRLKKKYFRWINQGVDLAARVQNVDLDNINGSVPPETLELINEFNQFNDETMIKVFAGFVFDWNWTDGDSGEPLPKPFDNPDVFNELYQDQLNFIQDRLNELGKYRATEGNAPSTTGLSIGPVVEEETRPNG